MFRLEKQQMSIKKLPTNVTGTSFQKKYRMFANVYSEFYSTYQTRKIDYNH